MSSTEQAPEPTMDEILASIRKIIADDDGAPAEQQDAAAAPAGSAEAGEPSLADDIASALNQPAEAAQPEEDILDLTSEVPNVPPPAPESPAPEPAAAEAVAQPELSQPEAVAEPPAPDLSAEAAMPPAGTDNQQPDSAAMQSDVLAGQPMQETGLPEQAMGFDAAEPQAGAVDAEFPETSDDMDAMSSEPAPAPAVAAEPEPAFAPEPEMPAIDEAPPADEPVAASLDTGTFAPEAEAEAAGIEEVPDVAAGVAMPESSVEADAAEAVTEAEDFGEAASSSEKSLEDSVKEMLKPMLREWLDENLPRIVEGEVKKEVDN